MKKLMLIITVIFITCTTSFSLKASHEVVSDTQQASIQQVKSSHLDSINIKPVFSKEGFNADNKTEECDSIKQQKRNDIVTFQIYSIPAGATFTLDNDSLGLTPRNVEIEDSLDHVIKISLDGYKTREFSISKSSKVKHLNFELQKTK